MEAEPSKTKALRHATSLKNKRRLCVPQTTPRKISSVNRRSRFWAKQMRRRRRMSLFDGGKRPLTRPHCQFSKRCNLVTTPLSARVDAKILLLLQRKKKQLKRDGLYQFVLWKEALKAERNRLMVSRSSHN